MKRRALFGLIAAFTLSMVAVNPCYAQKPVTLRLVQWKTEAREAIEDIIAEFHKKYPHITVSMEIPGQYDSYIQAKAAVNELPDVVGLYGTGLFDYAKSGLIQELTGAPFLSRCTPFSLRATTDQDGRVWGLPIDGSAIGVYYNKSIFQKYNLEVPRTMAELEKVCTALRKNNITPFALAYKDAWTIKMAAVTCYDNYVYGPYPDWTELRDRGQVTFAGSPEWRQVLGALRFILSNGNTNTAFETDYDTAAVMLATGKSAMLVQGLWALVGIRSISPEMDLGMFAMPAFWPDAKLVHFTDLCLCISADTKHPSEARLFLDFLTQQQAALTWCRGARLFSAVKGVKPDFDPITGDIFAYIDRGDTTTVHDRTWWSSFNTTFEKVLQEWMVGSTTDAEALKKLDDLWDRAKASGNR